MTKQARARKILKSYLEGKNNFNNLGDSENLKNGYMVALNYFGVVIDFDPKATDQKKTLQAIEQGLTNLYQASKNKVLNKYVLGLWENEGQLYIDVSVNYKNLETALSFGKANEQKAIWDLKNNKEIKI